MALMSMQCGLLRRKAGETLFREGEPATSFYILLSGHVQAFKVSAEGKEIILHLFNPGELFAEFPVFSGNQTYPVNTLCLKNSELLAINGQGFKDLAYSKPDLLLKILMRLSERLRYFTGLVEDLSLRNVDSRLAKYLLSACEDGSDEAQIEIHKKTLAAILGTVPETLSRSFKKFTQDDILEVQGNIIRIRNRKALQQMADIPAE
jgi:CRP/FNR family transcriptional regulator